MYYMHKFLPIGIGDNIVTHGKCGECYCSGKIDELEAAVRANEAAVVAYKKGKD